MAEVDNIVRYSDLDGVEVQEKTVEMVSSALTPDSVLNRAVFDEPKIITARYFNFNNLVLHRDEIRDLRLMPLKEESLHDTYNSLSRQTLLERIVQKVGDEKMVLLENEYPYQLPKDAAQHILWVREDDSPRTEIVEFLTRVMARYSLDDIDVIFFERSTVSKSKYVKRSFPFMRHIHVWIRRKI